MNLVLAIILYSVVMYCIVHVLYRIVLYCVMLYCDKLSCILKLTVFEILEGPTVIGVHCCGDPATCLYPCEWRSLINK